MFVAWNAVVNVAVYILKSQPDVLKTAHAEGLEVCKWEGKQNVNT